MTSEWVAFVVGSLLGANAGFIAALVVFDRAEKRRDSDRPR